MFISSLVLSKDELIALTDYVQPKKQAEELRRRGYSFELTKYGRPKILKSHVDFRLGAQVNTKKRTEPDYGALNELMNVPKIKNKR